MIAYHQMGKFWIVKRKIPANNQNGFEWQYLTRESTWEKLGWKTARFASKEEAEKAVKEAPKY